MVFVTGSPTQAFADAIRVALTADETLDGLVEGIYGHLSEAARTAYPYLVLGRRGRQGDAGTMQTAGSRVSLQIDCWSDHKGPSQAAAILSRVAVVLERAPLPASGFELVRGSLTCELEETFPEPDADNPSRVLYHGLQRWTGEIHESR